MKVYDEVPMWWYAGMFVASIAMALATNYTGEALLPWYDPNLIPIRIAERGFRWAFFIAVGFATIFLPIISTLYAVLWCAPICGWRFFHFLISMQLRSGD